MKTILAKDVPTAETPPLKGVGPQVRICPTCGERLYCDPEAPRGHEYCTYCYKCNVHYHTEHEPSPAPTVPPDVPRMDKFDDWDRWEMECE